MSDVLRDLILNHPSLPTVQKVYWITLTVPVTSAASEHSFSMMKYVKNKMQSTMSDGHLNDLLLISVEREFNDIEKVFDVERAIDSYWDLPQYTVPVFCFNGLTVPTYFLRC